MYFEAGLRIVKLNLVEFWNKEYNSQFSQSPKEIPGQDLKIYQDHFLAYTLQWITHY
jgi:hypothetical protein